MSLAATAEAEHSSGSLYGGYSTAALGLEAAVQEGALEGSTLTLSAGLARSDLGKSRTYAVSAAKAWTVERAGLDLLLGLGRRRDGDWGNSTDKAWAAASRFRELGDGRSWQAVLEVEFARKDPFNQWYLAPVQYVDDVTKARPIHFSRPDFLDTLPRTGPDFPFDTFAGTRPLRQVAPLSCFSMRPAAGFGFSLPSAWGAPLAGDPLSWGIRPPGG